MKKMMQATMTMSIGAQVLFRIVLYFLDSTPFPLSYDMIYDFNESCENLKDEQKKLLAAFVRKLRIIFKVLFVLHGFCQFFPFFLSFFNFCFKGKTVPPIPAFVPLVDRNSVSGFFLNSFLQLIISVALFLGNPAGDCTYVTLVTHLKPRVDLLECDLSDLEAFLTDNQDKLELNKKQIAGKLKAIIGKHWEILKYHNIFSEVVNKQFFVIITMNIYVICSSGISLLISTYTIAIGIAILYPIQIFFVCLLGSFTRHQHERLNTILWNFKWYLLPACQKKNFLIFLLNVQQPRILQLLFIGDIDMELYTKVRKLCY